ncbi:porphobilinogen synthase [Candidatus Nitrososphaera sp. FF02]|uniref:porphobilinogen synthase n=1 Tax=Candidatus Nitrososphaera sp. FF02 TaxID=3398226 RepID=UPI0039ED53FE
MQAQYADVLALSGLRREHLVCPVFVSERQQVEVSAMPGMPIVPVGCIAGRVQEIADAGIPSIILFGIPKSRNGDGSGAQDGVVQHAVREIKSAFGRSIDIITDVCLCQYNLSGHCGIIKNGSVDNDSTISALAQIATSHADAGADIVAPSAMMDGQVRAIRDALDYNGHSIRILSYSAKHASSLYTPFRSAAFAKKGAIDKSSYQVSYANPKQAMREMAQDIEEGADMVMVKPGLAYLDLVRRAKEQFSAPVAVQNVSGEYAMIKAAARRGWIDEEQWKIASIAAMRRAGADRIISYFALDVARHLQ